MTRPQEAISTYLDARRSEVAESTIRSHNSRLSQFCGWFEQQDDIEIMADLSPLDQTQCRSWGRDDGDLSPASEKTQMDTLRVFIRWCERCRSSRRIYLMPLKARHCRVTAIAANNMSRKMKPRLFLTGLTNSDTHLGIILSLPWSAHLLDSVTGSR